MERKSLAAEVNAILMQEWDPIGVSDASGAQDEYAIYVPQIIELLSKKASLEKLVEHLQKIARQDIGILGDPSRAHQTAAKILALHSHSA